jgi:hypothetical protein
MCWQLSLKGDGVGIPFDTSTRRQLSWNADWCCANLYTSKVPAVQRVRGQASEADATSVHGFHQHTMSKQSG